MKEGHEIQAPFRPLGQHWLQFGEFRLAGTLQQTTATKSLPNTAFWKPKGLNEHRGCYLNLGAAGKAQRHRGAEPAFFEHPPAHSPRDAGEKKKGWKQGHRSD